ncbi:unnamed protein product [Calypogeia fissa]
MASAPVVSVVPVVSHSKTSPAEEISDREVAAEDVIKQYEFMKLASEPSERPFIWPEATRPEILHNEYDIDLPLIDLTPVLRLQSLRREIEEFKGDADEVRAARSGLEAQMKDCEAAKSDAEKMIRAACEEYGFFEIINSGIPMEVVEEFRKCCRQMFDLPLERKLKLTINPSVEKPALGGYTPIKRKDAFSAMNPAYSWNEGFNVDSPVIPGRLEELADALWPGEDSSTKGQALRSSAEEYGTHVNKVIFLLMDLIVGSLGIPEESVDNLMGDRQKQQLTATLRAINYPKCEHPELTWGLHCHTDPDVITLLHQDAVGGLQIRFKDGTWHGVRPKPGAFLVNCGDFLQAWTNGRFLSAEHQVVANEKIRRMSVAFFVYSYNNGVISPRPEFVDAEHPPRYKPFTTAEYVKAILERHGLGQKRGEVLDKVFGI